MRARFTSTSWDAMPSDAWPAIADALTAAGVPWPDEAILFDLRWWAARERTGRVTRPGRHELRARWNVTDKVARLRMLAEEVWGDPAHEARGAKGPAEGQRRASRGPARGQVDHGSKPTTERKGPAKGQPRASEGPAEGPARGNLHRTQTQNTDTEERPLPASPSSAPSNPTASAVRLAWSHFVGALVDVGLTMPGRMGDTPPKGHPLPACVRDLGLEATNLLSDWACRAPDQLAVFNRDQGNLKRHGTPFRPSHRVGYLEAAREWHDAGRPTTAPSSGSKSPPGAAAWDDLMRRPGWSAPRRGNPPRAVGWDNGGTWLLASDEQEHARRTRALEAAIGSGWWGRWCDADTVGRTVYRRDALAALAAMNNEPSGGRDEAE